MKLEIKSVENKKSFKSTETSFIETSENVSEVLKRGIEAANSGNRHEARTLLMRATEADPKSEAAWLWLASISDYPEELFVFLQNVLAINPKNQRAIDWTKQTKTLLAKNFVQRGIASSQENKKDAARQCFLQAILHDSQNEMAWLWLASIVDSAEEKTSHLQKVLSINPDNESALSSLKMVNNQRASAMMRDANNAFIGGNRSRAKKLLSQLIKFDETYDDAWVLKAHLADSFDEKVAHFEHVLELNPNNEAAKSGLASVKSVMQSFTAFSNADAEVVADEVSGDDEVNNLNESVDEKIVNVEDLTTTENSEPVALSEEVTDEQTDVVEDLFTTESSETVAQLEELNDEPIDVVESVRVTDSFEVETPVEELSDDVFDVENETVELTTEDKKEEDLPDTLFDNESDIEPNVEANTANLELPEQLTQEEPNSDAVAESDESIAEEMVAKVDEDENFEVAHEPNELEVEISPEMELAQREDIEELEESALLEEPKVAEFVEEIVAGTQPDLDVETFESDEVVTFEKEDLVSDTQFSDANLLETQTSATEEQEMTSLELSSTETDKTEESVSETHELASDVELDSVLDSKILDLNVDHRSSVVQEEILDIIPVERENTQVGVYSFSKFRSEEAVVSQPEEISRQDLQTEIVEETQLAEEFAPVHDDFHGEPEQVSFETPISENQQVSKPEQIIEHHSVNRIDNYSCPFCKHSNEISSSICGGCGSALGFSDLDSILNNQNVVSDLVYLSIQSMELDKLDGIFSGNDFMMLGLAYLNVKDMDNARENLKVSLQINPINVSFAHILDEIENRTKKLEDKQGADSVDELDEIDENRRTIMVVDDSPTVRKLISSKLERHGHTVVSAVDGMDALAKINEIVPDLILLDITMPRLDGYQVCKLIKNNDATKGIPIVMISGKDGFFDKVRGKMAGSSGFISKPFGPEILMKTLETFTNVSPNHSVSR
jgi:CheY-like chemotaxis protein